MNPALNPHSPIPLYRQLADRIRADIDTGAFAVASRIPSEHRLAEQYAIGRPTVRQATDLLVRQGRLERRRGAGTFVLPPERSIDLFSLAGTSTALRKSELPVRFDILAGPERLPRDRAWNSHSVAGATEQDERSSEDDATDTESTPTGSEQVWLERCALVDDAPVLVETFCFDADLFAGIESHLDATQSVSALVRDTFFLEPSAAEQTFFAIAATERMAALFNIQLETPLLRVLRVLHFGTHRAGLTVDLLCPTEHFEFSQTLYPTSAKQSAEQATGV